MQAIKRYFLLTLLVFSVGFCAVIIGTVLIEKSVFVAITGSLIVIFSPLISAVLMYLKKNKFSQHVHFDNRIWQSRTKTNKISSDKETIVKKSSLNRRHLNKYRMEKQRLISSISTHRAALMRNIAGAIKKNDYGAVIADKRNEALDEFFFSIGIDFTLIELSTAKEIVFEQLEMYAKSDLNFLPSDGHKFEIWVSEKLKNYGWTAEVTSASGDQGIDIVACKNLKKIGIQCKLYNGPVGNKAVQEAYAGKQYYGVDTVCVLSNSTYTESAKKLAIVTDVMLLSHHDIPSLYSKLFD